MNTYHTLVASGLFMVLFVSPVSYIKSHLVVDDVPSNAWFAAFAFSFVAGLVLLFAAGNILNG